MEGYLIKQGHDVTKSWRRRYFRLNQHSLVYSKSPEDAALGTINLGGCKITSASKDKKRDFCFELKVEGRSYYICADSSADFSRWSKALSEASGSSGEALWTQTEEVDGRLNETLSNLKSSIPAWQEFTSALQKYEAAMEKASQAAAVYWKAFKQIASLATESMGTTNDIGVGLETMASAYMEIEQMRTQTFEVLHKELSDPLQSAAEEYKSRVTEMEKEFNASRKLHESKVKKAQKESEKAAKAAKKGSAGAMDTLQETLKQAADTVEQEEAHKRKFLGKFLIEERRRFCFLLMHATTCATADADAFQQSSDSLKGRLPDWLDLGLAASELGDFDQSLVKTTKQTYTQIDGNGADEAAYDGGDAYDGGSGGYGAPTSAPPPPPPMAPTSAPPPPPPPPGGDAGVGSVAVVYVAEHPSGEENVGEGNLVFEAGDRLHPLGDEEDGWMFGESESTGAQGYFPVSYCYVE